VKTFSLQGREVLHDLITHLLHVTKVSFFDIKTKNPTIKRIFLYLFKLI
jgi:hypothetical protein